MDEMIKYDAMKMNIVKSMTILNKICKTSIMKYEFLIVIMKRWMDCKIIDI